MVMLCRDGIISRMFIHACVCDILCTYCLCRLSPGSSITCLQTQTADFGENGIPDDDAVFIQQEPAPTAMEVTDKTETVQTRTYEEVVIVDYVEDSQQKNVSPLSTSTPRFTERSPIDDVLTGESSGSSSDSESDSENRRQRNPSSDK